MSVAMDIFWIVSFHPPGNMSEICTNETWWDYCRIMWGKTFLRDRHKTGIRLIFPYKREFLFMSMMPLKMSTRRDNEIWELSIIRAVSGLMCCEDKRVIRAFIRHVLPSCCSTQTPSLTWMSSEMFLLLLWNHLAKDERQISGLKKQRGLPWNKFA